MNTNPGCSTSLELFKENNEETLNLCEKIDELKRTCNFYDKKKNQLLKTKIVWQKIS